MTLSSRAFSGRRVRPLHGSSTSASPPRALRVSRRLHRHPRIHPWSIYYKTADTWNGKQLLGGPTDWVPFTPGTDFKDTLKARYIQLRVELYPDGRRAQSPRVSDLTVVYEPNPPPAPPAGLMASPGQREGDPHVARGERPWT